MNISSSVGFIIIGLVFSIVMADSATGFSVFLNMHAFLIVVGGTFAAGCMSFSIPRLFDIARAMFAKLFGLRSIHYQSLVEEIMTLSAAFRKNKQLLEAEIPRIRNPMLREAAEVLLWSDSELTRRDLRHLLETRAEIGYTANLKDAEAFRVLSKFPPAFGLMGTTVGMIILLQSLGPSGAKQIGPAMSVALVATLYGIIISNFLFLPLAEGLVQESKDHLVARRMIMEAIILISRKKPSIYVEEMVRSFLSTRVKIRRKPSPRRDDADYEEAA